MGLGHSCPWTECCSNRPGRFFVYFVCLFFWKKSNCRQVLVKEQPQRPPVLTWPVLLTCPSPAFPSSLFSPGSCVQVRRAALHASRPGLARVILTLEAGKLLETFAFSGEKKDSVAPSGSTSISCQPGTLTVLLEVKSKAPTPKINQPIDQSIHLFRICLSI